MLPVCICSTYTLSYLSVADFKQNVRAAPIRAVDVYNVMCWTLGVEPLPNNGSWSRVEYLLSGCLRLSRPFALLTFSLGVLGLVLALWD